VRYAHRSALDIPAFVGFAMLGDELVLSADWPVTLVMAQLLLPPVPIFWDDFPGLR